MRKIIITSVILGFMSATSFAAEPEPTVTIPASLAQSIYLHLTQGGTYASGSALAIDLTQAATAPQREKELRDKIEAEIKARPTQHTPTTIPAPMPTIDPAIVAPK